MSKEQTADLKKFLEPFNDHIKELALWLRAFVWNMFPEANELIYDNYNAVAFGWSLSDKLSDTFCSVAVNTDQYVHFGFYWGSKIPDPEKMLLGKGNQYRYIKVSNKKDFPKAYIQRLVNEAYVYSLSKMKSNDQPIKGATIVKSISAKRGDREVFLQRKKFIRKKFKQYNDLPQRLKDAKLHYLVHSCVRG
jgi:Domain of unknown function (DU1801)